jgi:FKBP-type peptidyl-prolyl cis-trans isomerase SlyD
MYLHGSYGQIFQRVEDELEGMSVGDDFNLLLSPEQAFGEYKESLVLTEPLDELPEDIAVGMELDGENEEIVWIVEEIADGYATLNANHELAGVALRVSGKVLKIEQLTEEGAQKILDMDHEH